MPSDQSIIDIRLQLTPPAVTDESLSSETLDAIRREIGAIAQRYGLVITFVSLMDAVSIALAQSYIDYSSPFDGRLLSILDGAAMGRDAQNINTASYYALVAAAMFLAANIQPGEPIQVDSINP